ncbi:PsbP protein [Micromonospora pattaloongensis]|uniref:non-specific serine/threonine protein kinase n=2 Tax=Micromonospora pattaloongensis TaxID=405436 RepID=A0A1H3GG61_9ACTN|nr:PsbP protein [Micromonospora pattaloongensis]
MGTVWRASDTLLRRDVAVKEVILPAGLAPSDRDALYERTLREARAAAALQHPAVVQVYDVVTDGGRPWIVMELLDARSLADMVIEDGPVAPRAVAKIGIALLGALEVAHANGVLHRDVKPANVLICSDGRCVLTDFGVARMPTEVQLTTPGMVLGSPHFISPERAMGQDFGPPSDLFSLGVTLYTAVEGRPPFDKGDPIETMHAVVEDPPAPPTRSGPLTQVLMGLLEKDPARRYDVLTARTMLRELLAGPLASKAPAALMTDPYAVVPAQRAPWQPPVAPPQPSGQIGGRAMLAPGESLTSELRKRQAEDASAASNPDDPDTTAALGTSTGALGAPTGAMPAPGRPAASLPAAPVPAPLPAAGRPAAFDAPTGALPDRGWGERTTPIVYGRPATPPAGGSTPGARLDQALAGARRGTTRFVETVKGWPRNVQLGAAAGVAVVLLLGTVLIFSGSDSESGPTIAQPSAAAPAAPAFGVQKHTGKGVALHVPQGWEKRTAPGVLYVDYVDPADNGRRVRVLVEPASAEPKRFLQIAEGQLKKKDSKSCAKPYEQLGLRDVEAGGKPAAELEYTCGDGAEKRHGIWCAVVQGGKAYSFYLTTPESAFAESKPIFQEMVRSFQLTAG